MGMSDYYQRLRGAVGHTVLMVPAVAAVIRDVDGCILVQQDSRGAWSLPAGAIEPGEAPAEAVVREVHEETGLVVKPLRVLGVFGGKHGHRYVYPTGDIVEYLVVVFECEVVGGALAGLDDETVQLRYFSIADMPALEVQYPLDQFRAGHTVFDWNNQWLAR